MNLLYPVQQYYITQTVIWAGTAAYVALSILNCDGSEKKVSCQVPWFVVRYLRLQLLLWSRIINRDEGSELVLRFVSLCYTASDVPTNRAQMNR